MQEETNVVEKETEVVEKGISHRFLNKIYTIINYTSHFAEIEIPEASIVAEAAPVTEEIVKTPTGRGRKPNKIPQSTPIVFIFVFRLSYGLTSSNVTSFNFFHYRKLHARP